MFLLLQSSNSPLYRTRLEDLEFLRPDTPPASLTWSYISADDQLPKDRNTSSQAHLFDMLGNVSLYQLMKQSFFTLRALNYRKQWRRSRSRQCSRVRWIADRDLDTSRNDPPTAMFYHRGIGEWNRRNRDLAGHSLPSYEFASMTGLLEVLPSIGTKICNVHQWAPKQALNSTGV